MTVHLQQQLTAKAPLLFPVVPGRAGKPSEHEGRPCSQESAMMWLKHAVYSRLGFNAANNFSVLCRPDCWGMPQRCDWKGNFGEPAWRSPSQISPHSPELPPRPGTLWEYLNIHLPYIPASRNTVSYIDWVCRSHSLTETLRSRGKRQLLGSASSAEQTTRHLAASAPQDMLQKAQNPC